MTLKEAAKAYFDLGLNIVPFNVKDKKPLIEWKHFQTERQTDKAFEALPWDQATGFAIVCGTKAKNQLHFLVIDCDNADFKLNLLPTTQIEKTPRGGYHFLYWSFENAKGSKVSDLKVELLGQGNLCIMSPSEGYKTLNDNAPTQVNNINEIFEKLILQLGGRPKREIVNIQSLLKGVKIGERDNAAIRLAVYWRKKGLTQNETFKNLAEWNLLNEEPLSPEIIEQKVQSAYSTLEPYNFVFNEESKPKIVFTPFLEAEEGILCEQAFDGKEVYFLVYDSKNGTVKRQSTFKQGDNVYQPILNDEVFNGTVLFPNAQNEYGSDEQLYNEVRTFMDYWHESSTVEDRELDVLYIFLSYIYDLLPQLPYRRNLASYGKGKSAWEETLGYISYRPLILAGSDTAKSLVRRLDLWRGTCLIDEADFGDSTLYGFITKILNIGYDRKTGWYQKCDEDDGKKTLSFHVYGPKLLATRKEFKDIALESRCLTVYGQANKTPKPLFRDRQFLEQAQALRNKLTLWRFRNYAKFKTEAGKLENPNLAHEVYGDVDTSSRIKQILLPLYILGNSHFQNKIVSLAEKLQTIQDQKDPDYEYLLKVKQAIIDLTDELQEQNGEFIVGDYQDENGELRTKKNLIQVFPETQKIKILLTTLTEKYLTNETGQNPEEITPGMKTAAGRKIKKIITENLHLNLSIDSKKGRWVALHFKDLAAWKLELKQIKEKQDSWFKVQTNLALPGKGENQVPLCSKFSNGGI